MPSPMTKAGFFQNSEPEKPSETANSAPQTKICAKCGGTKRLLTHTLFYHGIDQNYLGQAVELTVSVQVFFCEHCLYELGKSERLYEYARKTKIVQALFSFGYSEGKRQ